MDKLRTPDSIYFENGVINFSQQDRELYYEVWTWRQDGLNKSRYSNKVKLDDDELEVLRRFTKQDQVFKHLSIKVGNS